MSRTKLIRYGKIKISSLLIVLAIISFIIPIWSVGFPNFSELGWVFNIYWDSTGINFVSVDSPLFGLGLLSTILAIASIVVFILSPILAKKKSKDKYFLRIIGGILITYGFVIFSAGMDLAFVDWISTKVISIWGYLPLITGGIAIISGLIYMIVKRKENMPSI